ncbi:MAG: DNA-directed RNA polymerase subunit beta, partial [Candidatus Pacebacteria bacterium]|nr:DNA-directed RNA polymerase subunit beta [Candidatus Paceibacterota bacterium]
ALGFGSDLEIIQLLGEDERLSKTLDKDHTSNVEEGLLEIYKKLRPGEPPTVESAKSLIDSLFFDPKRYDLAKVGRYKYNKKLGISNRITGCKPAEDIIDPNTGELLAKKEEKISRDMAIDIENSGLRHINVLDDEGKIVKVVGNNFVNISHFIDFDLEGLKMPEKVYYPVLKEILDNNKEEKDIKEALSANKARLAPKHVMIDDIIASMSYVLNINHGIGHVDDIDHLGNRRLRSVGELLQNQFRIGLARMERVVKERMTIQDMDVITPQALINIRPVTASIKEFFGSSQLSQFMDQTNPLAELTHKRRLSALGPGGLSRERAGFEVRDVHHSHYGRMCPIETPEGPNIGLISSLACFARINAYGFIESPYRRVLEGIVQDDVRIINPGATSLKVGQVMTRKDMDKLLKSLAPDAMLPEYEAHSDYLSAWDEDKYLVAQANVKLDADGRIVDDLVNARKAGNYTLTHRGEVQYMDVSPKQLVSVAASLIPFLENDDANRALMGSNMQRQAVPLLRADSPIVGTGMEKVTARDSGATIICKRAGVVDSVDSERIIVRVEGNIHEGQMSREVGADIYPLTKFKRSNQNTCINQKPIVEQGQRVKKGAVLADGPCTDLGELALGRNVLVAFMPWRGYNFEDAIIVSEKLIKEDYYTSIHIEEFEIEARDTKLGPEEITRDIPNISEAFLRNLDESGIIRIGAKVKPGDILVGKVTPKGETQLTPEEKLLRAIFGEKAGDVKDASLYCPPGIEGVVVDAKVFSRKGADLDMRSRAILESQIDKLHRNLDDEKRILQDERAKRLANLLDGKELVADLHDEKTNKKLLSKSTPLTREILEKMKARDLKRMKLSSRDVRLNEAIDEIEELTSRQIQVLEKITEEKTAKLKKGDELPPGVIKMVKI